MCAGCLLTYSARGKLFEYCLWNAKSRRNVIGQENKKRACYRNVDGGHDIIAISWHDLKEIAIAMVSLNALE